MKKIILKSNWATKHTEAPYWSFELPLSELYAQLKEQGIDPECPFCECEDKYQQVYNSLFNKGELVCAKCHKPIKPTQKPKIEELEESEMSITDTVDKAEKMILTQKLNEVISAVNELYER